MLSAVSAMSPLSPLGEGPGVRARRDGEAGCAMLGNIRKASPQPSPALTQVTPAKGTDSSDRTLRRLLCQIRTSHLPNEPAPPEPARGVGMTDGELAEAKRYGRLELGCALADKALDVAYLAVAAFLLARPLDRWLQTSPLLAGNWTLRLAALFLVVMGIHIAVSFPLSFYSGHVLEHRFQLSTQTFGRWLWRYVKRNLLAVAFSLALVLGLYWLIWTDRRLVVAGGGGGVLRREHRAGPTGAGADPAAVLPHREARRPRADRSHRPAGRGHGPFDRGRLSHGPERGDGQGQRHAGRPGPHPPRAAGRYAAEAVSRPTRSKSSSPTRSGITCFATFAR